MGRNVVFFFGNRNFFLNGFSIGRGGTSENILTERIPFYSPKKEGSKRVSEAGDRSFFSVESKRNAPTDWMFFCDAKGLCVVFLRKMCSLLSQLIEQGKNIGHQARAAAL